MSCLCRFLRRALRPPPRYRPEAGEEKGQGKRAGELSRFAAFSTPGPVLDSASQAFMSLPGAAKRLFTNGEDQGCEPGRRARRRRDDQNHLAPHQAEIDPPL